MLRIPLPNAPAGSVMEGMGQANALSGQMLENQIKNVQAQYAPLTTQAEAASKLAYANLMGPQFLAKLMGNQAVVANSPQLQDPSTIAKLYQAGMGQGTGFGLLSQLQQQPQQMQQPQNFNPFSRVLGGIRNLFNPPQKTVQNVFGTQSLPAQDQRNISQMQPVAGSNQQPMQSIQSTPIQSGKTYFERAGIEGGIQREGEKLGELRANAIEEMGEQYQQAVQAEVPIRHLMEMTQDPTFINMRNKIPFFQDKQLNVLAKLGTPQEQQLIGDFITSTTNAVANTVSGFRGRILDKEITMANQMKINPNDTWNVMLGKLQSIATFNEMLKQRTHLAGEFMQNQHMNRLDAIDKADKKIDGTEIRKQMKDKLNPRPSDSDINYMAKKYRITPEEVKERLKKKGIY